MLSKTTTIEKNTNEKRFTANEIKQLKSQTILKNVFIYKCVSHFFLFSTKIGSDVVYVLFVVDFSSFSIERVVKHPGIYLCYF